MKNKFEFDIILCIIILLINTITLFSINNKTWIFENCNDTFYEKVELNSSKDIFKSKNIKFEISCRNLKTGYEASIFGSSKLSQEIVGIFDSIGNERSAVSFLFEKIEWYPFSIDVKTKDAKYLSWGGWGYVDGKDMKLGYFSRFDYLKLKEVVINKQKTESDISNFKNYQIYKNYDKDFLSIFKLEKVESVSKSNSIKFIASKICNLTHFKETISGEAFRDDTPTKMLNEKGDLVEAIHFVYKPTNRCSMSIYFDKATGKFCRFDSFGCDCGNKEHEIEGVYERNKFEMFDSGRTILKLEK